MQCWKGSNLPFQTHLGKAFWKGAIYFICSYHKSNFVEILSSHSLTENKNWKYEGLEVFALEIAQHFKFPTWIVYICHACAF